MNERLLYCASSGFEAARKVSILPDTHRSRGLHGHSFLAKVRVGLPDKWASFPGAEVDELRDVLRRCVAPLDYALLNDRLDIPTDENIARWIRRNLGSLHIENVGIQSTRDEGVDVDRSNHAHVWRRYAFESAHRLPRVPLDHQCGRMHGHGFEVIVHADQDIGQKELGVDYDAIDRLWAPIHQQLDRACLNEIAGLENPTSELISSWIWARLKPNLPELSWITVYETATCGAHFDGSRYRIWKELSMDSALRLNRAPAGDSRSRIHGHTYTLRLHLNAPLDDVMGWTIDFGDVKAIFTPVFKQLDHQPLYELAEARDNDAMNLLHWIRDRCSSELSALDRIDLYETRGCGAVLAWGTSGPMVPI